MSAPVSSRVRKAARPDSSESFRPLKQPSHIKGLVSRGFEAVADAFADNFTRRGELGGACCVYHRGEKVVDLWGGVRNHRLLGGGLVRGHVVYEHSPVFLQVLTEGFAGRPCRYAAAGGRGWWMPRCSWARPCWRRLDSLLF